MKHSESDAKRALNCNRLMHEYTYRDTEFIKGVTDALIRGTGAGKKANMRLAMPSPRRNGGVLTVTARWRAITTKNTDSGQMG